MYVYIYICMFIHTCDCACTTSLENMYMYDIDRADRDELPHSSHDQPLQLCIKTSGIRRCAQIKRVNSKNAASLINL